MTLTPYPDDVRVGDTQATAVYCNGQKIWEPAFPSVHIAAALSGVGTLSATAVPRVRLPAALSGGGTLSATLLALPPGASFVSAVLSGAGTLSAEVLPVLPMVAGLSGNGGLTATLAVVPQAEMDAVLSGDGALSATVMPTYAVAASLSGDSALSATATPVAPTAPAPTYSWDFHESSGSTTTDLMGTGNVLTAVAPATAWNGPVAAKEFDWTGSTPTNDGAVTFACDVKISTTSGWTSLLRWNTVSGGNGWLHATQNGTGIPGIYTAAQHIGAGPALVVGIWYRLVAVWTANAWTLYRDGTQIVTFADSGVPRFGGNAFVLLGDGAVAEADNLRMWTSALTPTQVAALSASAGTYPSVTRYPSSTLYPTAT